MHKHSIRIALALLLLAGSTVNAQSSNVAALKEQVANTERAFAKSMADRNFAAFAALLADETIFFGRSVLRGKAQVVEAWKGFFEGPAAPFSWEPAVVEVLESGTLAISTGPVRDPSGKIVSTFQSIWRLENGGWKIVFDKGSPVCDAKM